MASGSIKKEITNAQSNWQQEFNVLGRNNYASLLILLFGTTFGMFSCHFIGPSAGKMLHGITNAVENYHTVLSENRRLYNEVQDLKGATVWYCSIYLNY